MEKLSRAHRGSLQVLHAFSTSHTSEVADASKVLHAFSASHASHTLNTLRKSHTSHILRSSRPSRVELTFYQLFWIFVICSVVGLVAETLVSYPFDGCWKNRAGLLWGPFSPIYGVGAVLLTVSLNRFASAHPVLQFAVAGLVGGAFELIAGWLLENVFGIVAWSYINQPFNIGGYTCLGIAAIWGLLGVVWIHVGMPLALRLVDIVPVSVRPIVTAVACVFMFADIAMTLTAFDCWFQRQAGLPIDTPLRAFFAEHFSDDFMSERFQTMSLWANLAKR